MNQMRNNAGAMAPGGSSREDDDCVWPETPGEGNNVTSHSRPHRGRNSGRTDHRGTGRVTSQPAEVWLQVHVLSEFVYCRRAGIIALETEESDSGSELPPALDFLPDYDLAALRQSIELAWQRILKSAVLAAPISVSLVVVALVFDILIAVSILLACVPLLLWLINQVQTVIWLGNRLREHSLAVAEEPDMSGRRTQRVNWWRLQKAGFVSTKYVQAHSDETLRLSGKPWRVLQRGSQRIPVFRKRRGDMELHEQHFIRMIAYCHLIRTTEGADVPFGVVLFGDGYDGVAIAASDDDSAQLEAALRDARLVVSRLGRRFLPAVPDESAPCWHCPYARPRPYLAGFSTTILNGRELEARTRRDEDGRCYHSTCGDRFDWHPPNFGGAFEV